MTVVLTPFQGQTVLVLCWTGTLQGPSAEFARTFLAVPDPLKADAVVRLLFEQLDNLYFSPTWWEGLAAGTRAALAALIRAGTGPNARSSQALAGAGHRLLEIGVAEIATNLADPDAGRPDA